MSRAAMQQALEALEMVMSHGQAVQKAKDTLRAALAEPEQEPMATKQMLRWVEHLKRLSDDGQHMNIPGLSSGACWELAIELEQFIKNTAPTPRKPLTDEEIRGLADKHLFYQPEGYEVSGIFNFARAIERAHGIGEQT